MIPDRRAPRGPIADNPHDSQVYVLTTRRPRAACLCGWAGPHRITTGSARVDAWIHATRRGHMPAVPLHLDYPESRQGMEHRCGSRCR